MSINIVYTHSEVFIKLFLNIYIYIDLFQVVEVYNIIQSGTYIN